MLRVLLAALALLMPAPFLAREMGGDADERHAHAHSTAPWRALDFALPGSDAWVAVPVTALGDTVFDLRERDPPADPADPLFASMLFLALEGQDGPPGFGASTGSSSSLASARFQGEGIECCSLPGTTAGEPGSSSAEGYWLGDGQTAWITLIVANADTRTQPKVEIRPTQGDISVGERRAGTSVALVDLVREAYAGGTNVRLGDRTLLGSPAAVSRSFEPADNGLFFMHYGASGDARATISVTAAGQTLLDRESIVEQDGYALGMGTGSYEVAAERVDDGADTLSLVRPGDGWLYAVAIYADLDVPGAGVRADHHHHEG